MRILAKNFFYKDVPNPWVVTRVGTTWSDVIYAQDKFVAVGSSGDIAVSYNGFEWDIVATFVRCDLRGITYSNSLNCFIVVGADEVYDTQFTVASLILYSADGINWTKATSNPTCTCWLSVDSHPSESYLVAVGVDGYYSTSTNGTTWTTPKYISSTASYKKNLHCVKANSNSFVAVGTETIVSSYNAGATSWKTPYFAAQDDEYEYLKDIATPGIIGYFYPCFAVSTTGYLYKSYDYRNISSLDCTPLFDTSHRILLNKEDIGQESGDPNLFSPRNLYSIVRKGDPRSQHYYLYIGGAGRLYKARYGTLGTGTMGIEVLSKELVIPNDISRHFYSIEGIALKGDSIVLVAENGYIAYKQSI